MAPARGMWYSRKGEPHKVFAIFGESDVIKTAAVFSLILTLGASAALAQAPTAPSVVRNIVGRGDVNAGEAIHARTDIPSGLTSGRHIHHGAEILYVIEGELEYSEQGQPTRILKAGDSVYAARGVPHEAKAIGGQTARLSIVYVVDKDRPLSEPAQ
jgi:quercetin dioxygenase-like cupin family protein